MKIACMAFVTLIVLANVVGGLRQAYLLFRKKIQVCSGSIVLAKLGAADEWLSGDGKSAMFWPEVEFDYVIAGRVMKGNQISLARCKTSNRKEVEKRLLRYPRGRVLKVFYNADDPAEAYLRNPRKHIWTSLAVVIGMGVFGVGMDVMLWMVMK